MVSEDEVRSACLALPGATERPSWNRPAWFARTLFARMWDDDVLTVKTEEREALIATRPGTFYIEPHHGRSPELVLVRLGEIDAVELGELIEESHRIADSRRS